MFAFCHAIVAQQIRRKGPSRRARFHFPFTLLHWHGCRVVHVFNFLYNALCNQFLFFVDEVV